MISNGRSQRAPNQKGPLTANERSQRASGLDQAKAQTDYGTRSGNRLVTLIFVETTRWS
jgi:hypothetical protein